MANPYFNAAYYEANNPDVVAAGMDAETHYREFGAREAYVDGAATRAPAPWFDIQYYLAQNPDVRAAVSGNVAAAFDHFTQYGIAEGRAPSADYDFSDAQWSDYAAANQDLQDAFGITDPDNLTDAQQAALANHYFQYGYQEDRPADPITPTEGDTYTLTTGADDFTGTALDDVFDAPLADASGSLQGLLGIQTLGGQDKLDGGEGWDVLNAELNATGTTQNPTMTGIEELNLTVMPMAALGALIPSFGALDLSRADGYQEINNVGSRHNLSVENVRTDADGTAPILGLDGVLGGTSFTVDYDYDQVVDTQYVTANRVGSAGSGAVELDIFNPSIGSDPNYIDTLDLTVSNGVYLDLSSDANWMSHLVVAGSGFLQLRGDDQFNRLQTLDSQGYNEGLDIDVSGSHILERVDMGDGDDRVVVHREAVRNNGEDDNLSVDMGDGDDALAIAHVHGSNHITGLNFTGGIENVETLEFVHAITQGSDARLDLDGFDTELSTIQLDRAFQGNNNLLEIANSPADLTIDALSHIRNMELSLDAETLAINGNGVVDLDSLSGANLRSLDINQTQQAGAPAWMNTVWVDLDDSAGDLQKLEHIGITSEGNVSLELDGAAGAAEIAGVHQVEQIEVTNISNSGSPYNRTGTVHLTSSDLSGGFVDADYSTGSSFFNPPTRAGIASDIRDELNSSGNDLSATSNLLSRFVTITWDDFGEKDPLNIHSITANNGTVSATSSVLTLGVEHEDMIPGSGFEVLEDIVVDAAWDADVYLTDVYGDFTVGVTAGEDADVHLYNTNATAVTVVANEYAHIDVDGNTIGNPLLETISVSVEHADVDLEGNLSSFNTLDLTGVSEMFHVDASAADFEPGALGNYVSYVIGATSASAAVDYSAIDMAAAREMVTFTEEGFGTIVLGGFSTGNDPLTGDRVDLSELGFTNSGQLVFETGDFDMGTGLWTQGSGVGFDDVRITDLAGGPSFDGEIVLTGIAADIGDLEAYNMLYA